MARRPRRLRPKAPSRPRSHEHLRGLHQASGRHGDADGGAPAARPRRIPFAAGRGPAERQLPHHTGQRAIAGRRSPDDGLIRRDAAGGAVRPDSRHHSDDLLQRARLHADQPAVRSQPHRRFGRHRHSGGDQRGRRPAAARDDLPADDSQGESRRYADPGSGGHIGYPAADGRRCLCGKHPSPQDLADFGRRPRGHRRAAEAGHPGSGRSPGAGRPGHRPRGCPHRAQPGQCRPAQGHAQQPAPNLHAQHQ